MAHQWAIEGLSLPPQMQYTIPRHVHLQQRERSTLNQRRPPSYVFDTPANYRVRVLGPMDRRRSEYLCGMRISSTRRQGGPIVTTLTGELVDQAALMGVLNSLYDMGYPLLKVERLGPSPPVEP
jgi:hypothetical protein